ncbi:MAG TPA: succinate dehydrogenase, hydrophobic membrane anchor protein [Usitatibacter sp.]|nr:succinate dehydrogenase, hydrophobic membrane anchor protein [Usitatibacter sp.]
MKTGVRHRYTKDPVGAHYGLRDWLLQRVTAVVIAGYTLFVLGCFLAGRPESYQDLRNIFADGFIGIFTMLFLAALLYHAWVGMRDILMDYVKPAGIRLVLQTGVALLLIVYLIWSAAILMGARA